MPKILIVEDDQMISEIYEKKFEQSGFEVVIAETGRQVIKEVEKEKFDIVLLDMVLPEMSGIEILEELKSGKYNSSMKVIIFSNLNENKDKENAFKKGADGYISKTQYSPSDLVKEVQRMLSDYKQQENNKIRLEGGGVTNKNDGRNKILFIEDEDIFIEMFGEKLKDAGYEVEIAKNGAWGVKEALEKSFDLIIMDMVMPAMTGEEMLQKLRMEEKTKNIPVIAISASLDDCDLNKTKEYGVRECLMKTQTTPTQLADIVTELLK